MVERKRSSPSGPTEKNGGSTGTPSPEDTILRLGELAREVARLGDELRPVVGTESESPGAGGPVTPEALQRIDLLAAMLERETVRLADETVENPPAEPVPRTKPIFSTVAPFFTADEDSVGLDVPGLGSVSLGQDGASASIEGVGSASVGSNGVSVDAGGASVSVGGNGASVSLPGSGTVHVGPDGTVSVGPGKGSPGAGGIPGLPFPPIPCLESCEFKIPIPVPKFVAEPFEISVGIPKIDANPVPIPLPIPTPSPWPLSFGWPELPAFPNLPSLPDIRFPDIRFPDLIPTPMPTGPVPIPYPTIGGLIPGIPGPSGTGYNPGIENLIARLLKEAMRDVEDDLRDVAKRVRDWNEALGDTADRLVQDTRQAVEILGGLWDNLRAAVQAVHDALAATYGMVTDSVRLAAVGLRQIVRAVLPRVKDLLRVHLEIAREHADLAVGTLVDVANPAGAMIAAVRQIYLILNWIATRAFSLAGFSQDLFEDIIEFGARLDQVLDESA